MKHRDKVLFKTRYKVVNGQSVLCPLMINRKNYKPLFIPIPRRNF